MYKNKYIKYKTKYIQLNNKIHVGGEITSNDINQIIYLKNNFEKLKKVSQKNISQDAWSIIRLMTIIDNLHHPIPLQIKTNFYDEWIKKILQIKNNYFLKKKNYLKFQKIIIL